MSQQDNADDVKFFLEYNNFCKHGNIISKCRICAFEDADKSKTRERHRKAVERFRLLFSEKDPNGRVYNDAVALLNIQNCHPNFIKMLDILAPFFTVFLSKKERLVVENDTTTLSNPVLALNDDGLCTKFVDDESGFTYHEIAIDNDNGITADTAYLVDLLMHEFGHVIEHKLIGIAKEYKKRLCANEHRWADLIAAYLLHPDLMDKIFSEEDLVIRDTMWCIQKLCEVVDFSTVREKIKIMLQNKRIENQDGINLYVEEYSADPKLMHENSLRFFPYLNGVLPPMHSGAIDRLLKQKATNQLKEHFTD